MISQVTPTLPPTLGGIGSKAMAPKRSRETKTGEKALLTALEGYSLEGPKSQKAEEQEPKAKSKAKAKAKGKAQNEVKAKSKGANGTKAEKEDSPESSQSPVQSQAPPNASGAGASGEQLKEQFHVALSKLDDLACVKRQRVMPAEL
eukprot:s210_g2.t1